MHLSGFQGGADNAVQTGILGSLSVVHHHFVNGLMDQQIPLHGGLIGGGQLGHGNQQGTGAVRTGQTLQSGLHHGSGSGSVEVGDVHIQVPQDGHGLLNGVGDVVELQIQEDLVAPGLDLPDDAGAFGVVQLHADLDKGLPAGELVQKCEGGFCRREITSYDNVFTHYFAPPIISFRL